MWNGVILTLSTKDSNNTSVNHAAIVLADKEDTANFVFFLKSDYQNQEMNDVLRSGRSTIYYEGHEGSTSVVNREFYLGCRTSEAWGT